MIQLSSPLGPDLSPPPPDGAFKFAVLGDTHAFRGNFTAAARIAAHRGCRFMIQLGDFVDYDDIHDYQDFVSTVEPESLPLPVFLVRGNHETMAPDGSFTDRFASYIQPTHHSFEYGGALFCLLDNSDGQFAPPQLRECAERIDEFHAVRPAGPVFLFMHMPLDRPDFESPDMLNSESQRLRLIARRHGVTAIFAGHVHGYDQGLIDKTQVIVSGCGGGSLRAPSPRTHIVEVTVSSNGCQFETVSFPGQSQISAAMTYALRVQIPRHRARFLIAILLLFILSLLRMRRDTANRGAAQDPGQAHLGPSEQHGG